MKKIDKIIFRAFFGPFILTMLVVTFILLTQHMLKYFDDLVGKDLGWDVLSKLIFYFGVFVTPFAFPLGVLLSSLMSFGNLGEHSELTAIKSGGISLPRAMRSIFIFVIFLTGLAFVSNNYFVPKAALEAYSLMWDIKRKKPSLDLPEGEFYGGIENYRIKVEEKLPDGETLLDVIIYDHSDKSGNNEVTIADSGRMTPFMNERYLKFELFNGHSYIEGTANQDNVTRDRNSVRQSFSKVKFEKSQILFDLASFDLQRTDQELFRKNRLMRNLAEIEEDVDSLDLRINGRAYDLFINRYSLLDHFFKYDSIQLPENLEAYKRYSDSTRRAQIIKMDIDSLESSGEVTTDEIERIKYEKRELAMAESQRAARRTQSLIKQERLEGGNNDAPVIVDTLVFQRHEIDSVVMMLDSMKAPVYDSTISTSTFVEQVSQRVRTAKNRVTSDANYINGQEFEKRVYLIQYHKILANSVACIIMFLIGAPLGSIIKKGGLGFPVLISIFFFIIYYVFIIMGEKWAKNGLVYEWFGIWQANIYLLPFGLFFLYQAQKDARLFELDFYNVLIVRFRKWFNKKNGKNIDETI